MLCCKRSFGRIKCRGNVLHCRLLGMRTGKFSLLCLSASTWLSGFACPRSCSWLEGQAGRALWFMLRRYLRPLFPFHAFGAHFPSCPRHPWSSCLRSQAVGFRHRWSYIYYPFVSYKRSLFRFQVQNAFFTQLWQYLPSANSTTTSWQLTFASINVAPPGAAPVVLAIPS
jgi:hypothetical protein